MTTATQDHDVRATLNNGNLNHTAAALKKIKAGTALSKIKVTFAALADVAAHDITTDASKTGATINGIALDEDENLPPIGQVVALRTSAGTLAVHGVHVVGDEGTTPLVPVADSPGIARLDDDGKKLTFQAGVTAFVLVYYPAPDVDLNTSFPLGAP